MRSVSPSPAILENVAELPSPTTGRRSSVPGIARVMVSRGPSAASNSLGWTARVTPASAASFRYSRRVIMGTSLSGGGRFIWFFSQLRERRTADPAELLFSRQQTGAGRGRRELYCPAGRLGGVSGRGLAARVARGAPPACGGADTGTRSGAPVQWL